NHPSRLGKYPITGVLGEGAMGVVYKGFDPIIQRPVAIKTIHRQLAGSGDDASGTSAAARFRNEAQAVGRLLHPGIVAIYEYGEDDTTAFIAMELVEGRTLSQILEGCPKLPEADVLRIMDQLLAALDCAHHHGVWHRDIKPANILVTSTGQLKVTDFGIARIESMALTQITATIGTPGYMSPEQYRGEAVDHRVDLFACGVMLYRMLAGEQPFKGSVESVMYQILHKEPVPPSQVPGALRPAFYDAIVAKALAKDRNQRFASAAQFRAALAQQVENIPEAEAQTTVIVGHTMPAVPDNLRATEPAAPPPVALRSATLPPGWTAEELSRLELVLASFVGPMARVFVRQAAKTCGDLTALTTAVGAQLASDSDRQQFFTRMASSGTRATAAPFMSTVLSTANARTQGTATTQATASATGSAIVTAEAVAHALKVLTSHIGPIATVMVKKAQGKQPTEEQFYRMLAEHASEGPDRDKLLKALFRK
ncbi:MAG: hypothetical protein RLZZ618_1694, partial [Pseudomonadota bacterium]